MFDDFNWNNVITAGGSGSVCLLPLLEDCKTNKEKENRY